MNWWSRLFLVSTLLLFDLLFAIAQTNSWEVKTLNGESYEEEPQPTRRKLFAISLEDFNDAFTSAEYCVRSGVWSGLDRQACFQCSDCELKRRAGFTTEAEWQRAVTLEMDRLHKGNMGQTGTWIVEAPRNVQLNAAIINDLENSLGLSLRRATKSKLHKIRYFMVSGTPREIYPGLQDAGFTTCTPLPPCLKIDHELADALASGASSRYGFPNNAATNSEVEEIDIQIELESSQAHMSSAATATPLASSLATTWSGVLTTALGHSNADVRVKNAQTVTIGGLARSPTSLAALTIAAENGDVHRIGPVEYFQTHNRFAAYINIVQGNNLSGGAPSYKTLTYPIWDLGIRGQGQVVGVADSGLDWDHCFFRDSKVRISQNYFNDNNLVWESTNHRKIRQYATWKETDAQELANGHGTHVCGTVAGVMESGVTSDQGMPPGAKLAFFDLDDDATRTSMGKAAMELPMPVDTEVLPVPYRVGARIHSNSWGALAHYYTSICSGFDYFAWTHQDFLAVASVGNSGGTSCGSGCIESPASAKNVVAVGSSDNPTPWWTGFLSKDENHLSYYSSRGPAVGGRIKPDVVVPGNPVTSARAGSGTSYTCDTMSKQGTSMAAPVVAGLLALVRQYFTDGYYHDVNNPSPANGFIPMASLLKAVLVNAGQSLSGEEAFRQGGNFPNMDQGFGLVVIDNTLVTQQTPEGRKLYVDGEWSEGCRACPAVHEGDEFEYVVQAPTFTGSKFELKVTLVWADYPGLGTLLNDLDLTVEAEDGTVYHPNGGTDRDSVNNVEHIVVHSSAEGPTQHRVKVKGVDLMYGPQPYALVINAGFEEVTKLEGRDNVDDCAGVTCLNGGTCEDRYHDFECLCATGYEGFLCWKEINECERNWGKCLNGGVCVDGFASYSCDCTGTGFQGRFCGNVDDECAREPCRNGGVCVNGEGSFSCHCVNGFYGDTCSFAPTVESCADDGAPTCLHGGRCDDSGSSLRCECATGYAGDLCEIDVNECGPKPCLNGGMCKDLVDGFKCHCADGYDGATCEENIDDCSSNPCENDGVCHDGVNGYSCECQSGYDGDRCEEEIPGCAISPCRNGAPCRRGVEPGTFQCDCPPGLGGERCSTIMRCNDEDDVCNSNGDCMSILNEITGRTRRICSCDDGYFGQVCDKRPCLCRDKGDCDNGPREENCECQPGFGGPSCIWVLSTLKTEFTLEFIVSEVAFGEAQLEAFTRVAAYVTESHWLQLKVTHVSVEKVHNLNDAESQRGFLSIAFEIAVDGSEEGDYKLGLLESAVENHSLLNVLSDENVFYIGALIERSVFLVETPDDEEGGDWWTLEALFGGSTAAVAGAGVVVAGVVVLVVIVAFRRSKYYSRNSSDQGLLRHNTEPSGATSV